jgi:hypothetical protein
MVLSVSQDSGFAMLTPDCWPRCPATLGEPSRHPRRRESGAGDGFSGARAFPRGHAEDAAVPEEGRHGLKT